MSKNQELEKVQRNFDLTKIRVEALPDEHNRTAFADARLRLNLKIYHMKDLQRQAQARVFALHQI